MIIGIISVRNHRYHPNKRLMEAARGLEHRPVLIHPARLLISLSREGIHLDQLTEPTPVDVVIPRMGATVQPYPLTIVRHFELARIRVINTHEAISLARNKFVSLQTLIKKDIPVPASAYASNWRNFERAVRKVGGFPVIVKTVYGRQGSGVFLIKSMADIRGIHPPLLPTGQGIVVQKYFPTEKRRDIRVVVVGDKAVGAMSLTPRRGDFRTNIHLHGRAEKIRVTKRISSLATKATRALGLEISGVDMIEEEDGALNVIEVNYSPGFKGLERCTGRDIAAEIIRYVALQGSVSA